MINNVIVDCAKIHSIDDFHDIMFDRLAFPAHYGRNRDAFWDCLTDIADDTVVVIENLSDSPPSVHGELLKYIELMEDYQGEAHGNFKVQVTGLRPKG